MEERFPLKAGGPMIVFAAEGLTSEQQNRFRQDGQLLETGEEPKPWYGPDGQACQPIVVQLDMRPAGQIPEDLDGEPVFPYREPVFPYSGNVIPFTRRDPDYDWGDE
jgi:hypothetical protein